MHTLSLEQLPDGFDVFEMAGENEVPYEAGKKLPENVYIRLRRRPGFVGSVPVLYLIDDTPVKPVQETGVADLREDLVLSIADSRLPREDGQPWPPLPFEMTYRLQTNTEIFPK